LFNTLGRISHSLRAINEFRTLVEAEESEAEEAVKLTDRVTKPHHVIPEETHEDPIEKDFAEYDEEVKLKRKEPTIAELFSMELRLTWNITKYVLWGWFRSPLTLYVSRYLFLHPLMQMLTYSYRWEIFVLEISRFWEYYIGLPVSPRKWTIVAPNFDEL